MSIDVLTCTYWLFKLNIISNNIKYLHLIKNCKNCIDVDETISDFKLKNLEK